MHPFRNPIISVIPSVWGIGHGARFRPSTVRNAGHSGSYRIPRNNGGLDPMVVPIP